MAAAGTTQAVGGGDGRYDRGKGGSNNNNHVLVVTSSLAHNDITVLHISLISAPSLPDQD